MTEHSNLYLEPVIHDTRNEPQSLSFTDRHVMIELADGRIIGVPLCFFPLIEAASDDERRNYRLGACDVYWEDIDDGIDLRAMLSGLYLETSNDPQTNWKEQIAERESKAAAAT